MATVDAYNSLLGKYWTQIRVGPYERPTPLSKGDFKTDRFIILPLPTELRDDTAVGYTNLDLTSTGDVINGSIGGGLAAYALRKSGDVISGGASAIAGAGAGALAGLGGEALGDAVQEAVSGGIAEAFPPDQVASAIQQSLGAAPNPNPSVMFTGPSLREFNFSWTFYPRNLTESKKIKDIVEYLKRSALPSNKLSGSASVLSYPMMTQFNFWPWDKGGKLPHGWTDRSIIRMKRTMMTAVNVNYAPSNVPSFFGGDSHPVAIGLSISLREIEYMLSEDWGGSGGGLSADEYKNTIVTKSKEVASQATDVVSGINNSDNTQDSTT
jgi:hypothetical protein